MQGPTAARMPDMSGMSVVPAKAGTQGIRCFSPKALDSRLRGNDNFLHSHRRGNDGRAPVALAP